MMTLYGCSDATSIRLLSHVISLNHHICDSQGRGRKLVSNREFLPGGSGWAGPNSARWRWTIYVFYNGKVIYQRELDPYLKNILYFSILTRELKIQIPCVLNMDQDFSFDLTVPGEIWGNQPKLSLFQVRELPSGMRN